MHVGGKRMGLACLVWPKQSHTILPTTVLIAAALTEQYSLRIKTMLSQLVKSGQEQEKF